MRSKRTYTTSVFCARSKCNLIGEKQGFFVKSGVRYFMKLINYEQSVHNETLHT